MLKVHFETSKRHSFKSDGLRSMHSSSAVSIPYPVNCYCILKSIVYNNKYDSCDGEIDKSTSKTLSAQSHISKVKNWLSVSFGLRASYASTFFSCISFPFLVMYDLKTDFEGESNVDNI